MSQSLDLSPEESVQVHTSLRALREQFHGMDVSLVLSAMNLLTAELVGLYIEPETQPRFLETFAGLLRANVANAARGRLKPAGGRVH